MFAPPQSFSQPYVHELCYHVLKKPRILTRRTVRKIHVLVKEATMENEEYKVTTY